MNFTVLLVVADDVDLRVEEVTTLWIRSKLCVPHTIIKAGELASSLKSGQLVFHVCPDSVETVTVLRKHITDGKRRPVIIRLAQKPARFTSGCMAVAAPSKFRKEDSLDLYRQLETVWTRAEGIIVRGKSRPIVPT